MFQLQPLDKNGKSEPLHKYRMRIGRGSDNDIRISDSSVSELHAELLVAKKLIIVVTSETDSETYVNGQRISKKVAMRLGDDFRVGSVVFRVVEIDDLVLAKWEIEAKDSGTLFPITEEVSVGREPDCEISIPDSSVSRLHAKLLIENNALVVMDLESRNGTWVNGEQVDRKILKQGDEVRFGKNKYCVRSQSPDETSPEGEINLDVNRTVLFDGKLEILPNENIEEPPQRPPTSQKKEPRQIVEPRPELDQDEAELIDVNPIVPPPKSIGKLVQKSSNFKEKGPKKRIEEPKPDIAQEDAKQGESPWWNKDRSAGPAGTIVAKAYELGLYDNLPEAPDNMTVPILIGLNKGVKGQTIRLSVETVMFGRNLEADSTGNLVNVTINDDSVSDKHAQIILEREGARVVSLPNNTNGTFVNNKRILGHFNLRSGDVLRFGEVDFVFRSPRVIRRQRKKGVFLFVALILGISIIVALTLVFLRMQ